MSPFSCILLTTRCHILYDASGVEPSCVFQGYFCCEVPRPLLQTEWEWVHGFQWGIWGAEEQSCCLLSLSNCPKSPVFITLFFNLSCRISAQSEETRLKRLLFYLRTNPRTVLSTYCHVSPRPLPGVPQTQTMMHRSSDGSSLRLPWSTSFHPVFFPLLLDDWCRVKLSKLSPTASDYINASYMPVGINNQETWVWNHKKGRLESLTKINNYPFFSPASRATTAKESTLLLRVLCHLLSMISGKWCGNKE